MTPGGALAKSKSKSTVRRDTSDIARRSLLDLSAPLRSGRELLPLEDRRQFYPGVFKPASRLDRGKRAFLTMPGSTKKSVRIRSKFSHIVKFEAPQSVLVCVRRHRRREVLFAKGKGGGGKRPPRRNAFSDISCRRK